MLPLLVLRTLLLLSIPLPEGAKELLAFFFEVSPVLAVVFGLRRPAFSPEDEPLDRLAALLVLP